jgi:hypothetical protein
MLAKAKRKVNGKWITGYPLTYGFEDKWYFVPESINELEIVPVEKKTICRYTGEMLSDGRRLHEFDKVEVKDADGNKILGIIRFGTYQSSFDSTATAHIGFYVDWQDNLYWRKDLGYWVNSDRMEIVGSTKD